MKRANRLLALGALALAAVFVANEAAAFCGFYVARADARLFNRASQVAIARHADRTVLTMTNDFQGDLDEFAIVIPVPTFIAREQIHVGDRALLDHLDAYTAPRLVEYFDPDPCARQEARHSALYDLAPRVMASPAEKEEARSLGVTIEAEYTVGEYDIVLLSATESAGLVTWLTANGYRMPDGAERTVGSYLRQGMRFFLAKVNLSEQARLGYTYLRPLQVAYESPKFVLPIRLGTLNADGDQELFVYLLTKEGRVETTNYRTVRLPSGMDIPVFVKDEFPDFYRDLFATQVERENEAAVFLEYAWDMGWCDPCAADPLSVDELHELGVFWIDEATTRGAGRDVFVTRLHVRYDGEHFPEDLVFQETRDRSNFQARFVLRHAWTGEPGTCAAGDAYRETLDARWEQEARTLANLTGRDVTTIRERMRANGQVFEATTEPWWRRIWGGS